MMKIIDVSSHQGKVSKIDWQKVKSSGVYGVMIRAGYGQGNIDSDFEYNIKECNKYGIPCGVYWFSYAKNAQDAIREANYCLNAIAPYRVELPVAYDFEYESEQGRTFDKVSRTSLVYAFCCQIQAAGYYSMVYTNGDYMKNRFGDISPFDIWYAAWQNNPNLTKAPVDCGIWQWGSSKVNGIVGDVDTNECYRNYPSIIRSAGLNHLAEKEPEKPMTAEEKLDKILAELTEWKTGGKQ